MAKFTATAPIDIRWAMHTLRGAAGTVHRLTDALVDEFIAEVAPGIPGLAWVTQDELTSVVTLPIAETDVTGLTADLAAKFPASGGIITGATTVASSLKVNTNAIVSGSQTVGTDLTVSGAAIIQGATTASGALTAKGAVSMSSTLGVDGVATLKGAVNASSTLGVTGKATFGNIVAWGGTAFPGSPATNDLFHRTDYDLTFYYDGTRWLSTTLYFQNVVGPGAGSALTATSGTHYIGVPDWVGTDVWVVDTKVTFFVASGGNALSATDKWTITATGLPSGSAVWGTLATIDSGSSAVWREATAHAVNALLGTDSLVRLDATKTGSPGNLTMIAVATFRIVAT